MVIIAVCLIIIMLVFLRYIIKNSGKYLTTGESAVFAFFAGGVVIDLIFCCYQYLVF